MPTGYGQLAPGGPHCNMVPYFGRTGVSLLKQEQRRMPELLKKIEHLVGILTLSARAA